MSVVPMMLMLPSCFRKLDDIIGSCVSKFTPLKRVGNFHFPSWFSKELKDPIFEKKILHRHYKETLDINTNNLFSTIYYLRSASMTTPALFRKPCLKILVF
ncbi:hypothetical protein J6590_025734 [Homalodisca vitripennis]|nr:hypothetical protein J6590_025734 [Homalodisca vitripennis]